MSEAIIMIRLAACGPRKLGETIYGVSLDDYPLEPGKALWIKQATDEHGKVSRYTSEQQAAVSMDDIDWQPL